LLEAPENCFYRKKDFYCAMLQKLYNKKMSTSNY